MNTVTDDARITAYALGQADAQEASDIQAAAEASADVRDLVEGMRDVARAVSGSLGAMAGRWSQGLGAERRAALLAPRRRRRLPFGLPRPAAPLKPVAVVAATMAAFSVLCLASPAGSVLLTVSYAWLDQTRSSSGHQSAARTVSDINRVTIWDVLSGRGPDAMRRTPLADDSRADYASALEDARRGFEEPTWAAADASAPAAAGTMVVKTAALTLAVPSMRAAVERVSAIAAQHGGFVVESQAHRRDAWRDGNQDYDYAFLVLRIPAQRVDAATMALRALASRVIAESSSGSDVTQEYVDLQSELANLEATRARVRAFLDDAQTVDQALSVNVELSRLEGQINVLKGRSAYLADRAAYATVTVELHSVDPDEMAAAAAMADWSPRETTLQALAALQGLLRALATLGIWLVVVVLPFVAPFWFAAWLLRRRRP